MSLSMNLNQIPVHQIPTIDLNSIINRTVLAVVLVDILLLQLLLNRKRISNFLSGFQPHDAFPISSEINDRAESTATRESEQYSGGEEKKVAGDRSPISGGDLEIVLTSLGLVSSDGEGVPAGLEAGEIVDIFEERSPVVEEVREAFHVFDSNRDGFIDAEELQRVLRVLGLREGSEMDKCRRMIASFDEDGDGRINLEEFVKLMEISFS